MVAGVTAVSGLVALTNTKGSKRHIFAGRVFGGCMIVAAALRRTPDGKGMLEREMLALGGLIVLLGAMMWLNRLDLDSPSSEVGSVASVFVAAQTSHNS